MKQSKKLRRTKSNVFLSDALKLELDYKSNSPDKPLHESVESYFSTASGFTNFRGLLNLMIILLVLSNLRVALENILKYGILIRPFIWAELTFNDPYHWPCIYLILVSNVFILTIFAIEVLLEKKSLSYISGVVLEVIILASMLIYSSYVILVNHPSPLFSAPVLSVYSGIFLKLWSYAHVNKWCRDARDHQRSRPGRQQSYCSGEEIRTSLSNGSVSGDYSYSNGLDLAPKSRGRWGAKGGDQKTTSVVSKSSSSSSQAIQVLNYQRYPDNLNLYDLYYFIFAPTLCYELNFPRTLSIRKRFLFKRVLEMLFLPQLMMCLIQQWIIPLLRNSVLPFSQSHFAVIAERLLKLSIPNHIVWLMFFYVVFHSALNVCAELMYFSDRLFYKDWWNAMSVTEFWSTWNVPVHRWARRHVFKPLLSRNYSKLVASTIVFFISAFFHELLISVPLRMFRLWSFGAMLGQIPFAVFVSRCLRGSGQLGNCAVWVSLIIGQPLAMMMYFHDYYVQTIATASLSGP